MVTHSGALPACGSGLVSRPVTRLAVFMPLRARLLRRDGRRHSGLRLYLYPRGRMNLRRRVALLRARLATFHSSGSRDIVPLLSPIHDWNRSGRRLHWILRARPPFD